MSRVEYVLPLRGSPRTTSTRKSCSFICRSAPRNSVRSRNQVMAPRKYTWYGSAGMCQAGAWRARSAASMGAVACRKSWAWARLERAVSTSCRIQPSAVAAVNTRSSMALSPSEVVMTSRFLPMNMSRLLRSDCCGNAVSRAAFNAANSVLVSATGLSLSR